MPPGWLVIGLPALAAALAAGIGLGSRSLWLDEAASVAIASQHGSQLWHAMAHDGGNMLAFYALLHVLIGLFGSGEVVIRMPAVLAHAATAALTAAIAWRLFGRPRAALAAGLLTAISLPLVFWGQDARGYALMVAFATGSVLAFTAVVDPTRRRPGLAEIAYVLTSVIALYMSFYAVFVILAELAVLPLLRSRARAAVWAVLASLVVVGAACIPLVVLALDRGSGQLFWVPHPTFSIVGQTGLILISSGLPPVIHISVVDAIAAGVTVPIGLALVALAISRPAAPAPRHWVAVSWLVVPLAVMLVAALAGEPIELERAVILVIPAVAILLAVGLETHSPSPVIGWGALGLLLVMRLLVLIPAYGSAAEPWKAATAHVATASRPGVCVLFYPEDVRMPFDYYLRGTPGAGRLRSVFPALGWSVTRPYVENYALPGATRLAGIVRHCPELWVIASHQGSRSGPPASVRDLRRYNGLLAGLRPHYRRVHHVKFGYAAVIHEAHFSR